MVVTTMNVLFLLGLHKAEDLSQPLPVEQAGLADPLSRFLRDFIVGCLVVVFCGSFLLVVNLLIGVPGPTKRAGAVVMPALAVGLALWLFFSLRQVKFLYARLLYDNTDLRRPLALSVAFVVLLLVEQRFSSRPWRKVVLGAGTCLIAALAGSLLADADEYVYTDHFNANFHSIVQVVQGKTLLVDLTNQYGFYPYFLEPVFRLAGFDAPR